MNKIAVDQQCQLRCFLSLGLCGLEHNLLRIPTFLNNTRRHTGCLTAKSLRNIKHVYHIKEDYLDSTCNTHVNTKDLYTNSFRKWKGKIPLA
jgi:hypothetical protein